MLTLRYVFSFLQSEKQNLENASISACDESTADTAGDVGRTPCVSISNESKFSEYYFGMCVAQMMEDVPKSSRPLLKANMLKIVAMELQ